MRKVLLVSLLAGCLQANARQEDYSKQAVPFTQVKLTDHLWISHIETNRTVTIPASFERCDKTGRVKNFIMAAKRSGKFCTTFPLDDTDIYKTIGTAYRRKDHDGYSLLFLVQQRKGGNGDLVSGKRKIY